MLKMGTLGVLTKFNNWLLHLKNNTPYFFYALLVHIVFILVLVFSLDWSESDLISPEVNIIDAVVVDESKIQAELDKIRQAESRKRKKEEDRQHLLNKKAREAELARKKEERRLADIKQKQEQAKINLKREQERRKQEEQRTKELEQKKREEELRLATLKEEQEAIERRKQEEEQRRLAEKQLKEQLAAEQRRLEEEEAKRVSSVVDRYMLIIRQRVEDSWIKSPNFKPGLSCYVSARLMPGGEVASVIITEGSGDPVFDRSVELAVRKASPFPLPADRSMFDHFREVKFIFKPEK